MKMLKKGEKGFTLIELLIVVAILGVLAAIVIPNVGRFIGSGEEEAKKTELQTVQSAVQSLMVAEGVPTLPILNLVDTEGESTNDMSLFPVNDASSNLTLFDAPNGNLVASNSTSYKYWVDVNGTVHQGAKVQQ